NASGGISVFNYEGTGLPLMGLLSGAAQTALVRFEQFDNLLGPYTITDNSVAIPLIWQSRYYDQELPDNQKTFSDLVIDYRTSTGGAPPSTLLVELDF